MNPDKHIVYTGDYSEALSYFYRNGGMLFPPKTNDHHTTIVKGQSIITFFPPDSQSRQQCYRLAKEWELPEEICQLMTAGRLAKYYIDNRLGLPYPKTFFSKDYQKLAKEGYHWHYLFCKPTKSDWGFEFDLKSAYATAWTNRPSLLYHPKAGWMRDNGAINRLKADLPYLPKWFRLALLGVIASHQCRYFVIDKETEGKTLKPCYLKKISYGAAFNAAHVAVWKVWNTMRQIHEMTGEHCLRIHTDGAVISWNAQEQIDDAAIVNFIKSKGFDFSIKASGHIYIDNVGEGIVGRKVFGNKKVVLKDAWLNGFHPDFKSQIPPTQLGYFGKEAVKIGEMAVSPNKAG